MIEARARTGREEILAGKDRSDLRLESLTGARGTLPTNVLVFDPSDKDAALISLHSPESAPLAAVALA
jgi:hypothetical protein